MWYTFCGFPELEDEPTHPQQQLHDSTQLITESRRSYTEEETASAMEVIPVFFEVSFFV